jgi:hypothetical protein
MIAGTPSGGGLTAREPEGEVLYWFPNCSNVVSARAHLMAVRHETSTNPPRQFLLVFDVAGKTQLQRLTSDNLGTHGCNIYQIRIGGHGRITHQAGRGHRYYAAAGFGSRRGHPLCNRRLARICDRYFFRRCRCIREKGGSNIRIGMLMEIATTLGAVLGASLAFHIPTSRLGVA